MRRYNGRVRRAALPLLVALAACGGSGPGGHAVAQVEVTLERSGLTVGEVTRATAVVRDAGGVVLEGREVAWTTSASGVVRVGGTGTVTAIGAGSVMVTATSEGVAGGAPVSVAAPVIRAVRVSLPTSIGVGQTAQGAAVAVDADGAPVAATVAWSTTSPSVATVSPNGLVVAVGVGSGEVVARAGGVRGTARIEVSRLAAVSAPFQSAAPFQPVTQPPAVRLTDGTGAPVVGAPVSFTVSAGGGTVTGAAAVTDHDGLARAGAWVLGEVGPQEVVATSPSAPAAAVHFAGTSRAPGAGFDVTLRFLGPLTDAQARAFVAARERVSRMITGDLPDAAVDVSAQEMAGCLGRALHETVDDLLVLVQVAPIDGAGNVLGQSRACLRRGSGSALPVVGYMWFDSADLDRVEAAGSLDALVLHEMLHVLGFGTIWSSSGLLSGAGGPDPWFQGATARAAFLGLESGLLYGGTPVPVEGNAAPSGTRDSHWRESVFGDELMTGYLARGSSPLGATSVASFLDLGYDVDLDSADAFAVAPPAALRTPAVGGVDEGFSLAGDVADGAPTFLDPAGRPFRR